MSATVYCSFCGKANHEVKLLIAGPTVFICDECVAVCVGELGKKGVDVDVHPDAPRPMLLWCPECSLRHVDAGEFATKHHHTHACQGCGHVWRPALFATVGVQFLPGFKNEEVADG